MLLKSSKGMLPWQGGIKKNSIYLMLQNPAIAKQRIIVTIEPRHVLDLRESPCPSYLTCGIVPAGGMAMGKKKVLILVLLLAVLVAIPTILQPLDAGAAACVPTRGDMLGPFYRSDAPVRASVGTGYVLQGIVRSAKDCSPLSGAKIELWLAGPDGRYDDAHRATLYTDTAGAYRFESSVPRPVDGRPPHIHLRVSARGFATLVTQHYPQKGTMEAIFDLVLMPER
jgi:hypothetical protein